MTIKSIAKQTATIIRPLLSDIANRAVSIWAVVADSATDMTSKETGEFKTELIATVGGYDSLLTRAVAIGRFMNEAKVSESYMCKAYKVLGERIIGNLSQQKTEAAEIKSAFGWAMETNLLNTRNVATFKADWKNEGLKIAQSNIVKALANDSDKGKGKGGGGDSDTVKLEKAEKNLEASRRNHNETKASLAKVKGEITATQKRNNALAAAIDRIASLAADPKFPAKKLRGECLELRAFITQTETVAADPVDRDAAKLQRFAAKSKKAAAANKGIARKKAAAAK